MFSQMRRIPICHKSSCSYQWLSLNRRRLEICRFSTTNILVDPTPHHRVLFLWVREFRVFKVAGALGLQDVEVYLVGALDTVEVQLTLAGGLLVTAAGGHLLILNSRHALQEARGISCRRLMKKVRKTRRRFEKWKRYKGRRHWKSEAKIKVMFLDIETKRWEWIGRIWVEWISKGERDENNGKCNMKASMILVIAKVLIVFLILCHPLEKWMNTLI